MQKPILVVGDLLLDVYTQGTVCRISPEAPIPILDITQKSTRLGGAGNVVLNLQGLECTVDIMARVGSDAGGEEILSLLQKEEIKTSGIFIQKNLQTPIKNRFIGSGQQLMRADWENTLPFSAENEKKFLLHFTKIIDKYSLIAISDYGKGLLSKKILQAIIKEGKKRSIPVIVDPKGTCFKKYQGSTLIKPNLKELYTATKCEKHTPLITVAEKLFEQVDTQYLLVTQSEQGMTLVNKNLDVQEFPVKKKSVIDVTGAGDTAFAALAFGLSENISLEKSIELANKAAGIAVEKLGCVAIQLANIDKKSILSYSRQ